MRLRTNEALIGTPGVVVKTRTIRILPEDEKWSGASILDVKGTPRRPNPLVDDDNIPEDITECAFDQQGQDDQDRRHEENASQEPVLVRMSEVVPSHCDRRSVEKYVRDEEADSSAWEDTGMPRVREPRRKERSKPLDEMQTAATRSNVKHQ